MPWKALIWEDCILLSCFPQAQSSVKLKESPFGFGKYAKYLKYDRSRKRKVMAEPYLLPPYKYYKVWYLAADHVHLGVWRGPRRMWIAGQSWTPVGLGRKFWIDWKEWKISVDCNILRSFKYINLIKKSWLLDWVRME